MSKKNYVPVFIIEALLCVAIAFSSVSAPDVFAFSVSFPFTQIGTALRWLSLSGSAGNAVAIVIYVVISLAPCIALLIIKRRRALFPEDWVLAALSALLFAVVYQAINPEFLSSSFIIEGGIAGTVARAVSGTTVYSVLCAYIVLRLLRLFFESDTERLQKHMIRLLYIVNAVFVFFIFGTRLASLPQAFRTLASTNTGFGHSLGLSYVFVVLTFVIDVIPYVFNIAVVFSGITFLRELGENRYSDESVVSAGRLSKICKLSLIVTVSSNAGFNALQFLLASRLTVISSRIQIPVYSILFVLAVLLLSRFATENKALKDDNDSFI